METKNTKIVDLTFGAHILSTSADEAKKLIVLMVENFYAVDKKPLQEAHEQKKWQEMAFIVDKLMGGLFFCGTPRLRNVVICLNTVLKRQKFKLANTLYYQFLREINAVKKYISIIS